MRLDRCCALIDKRRRPELAGNLRASWQPERNRIVFVVRRRERVLRSKRAFFVISTEAKTSLTVNLVNGASLQLVAFTLT
jgi:hypothetical protein